MHGLCASAISDPLGQGAVMRRLDRFDLAAHLEDLLAGQQEGLVRGAEANAVGDAPGLEHAHVDAPQPQHGEHDEERLVIDVEQLGVLRLRAPQAGHDCVHRAAHAGHEQQEVRAVALPGGSTLPMVSGTINSFLIPRLQASCSRARLAACDARDAAVATTHL